MYELDDSEVEEDLKLICNKVIITGYTEIQKVKCYYLENHIMHTIIIIINHDNGDTTIIMVKIINTNIYYM